MSSERQQIFTLFRGGKPTAEYVWSPFANKLEARLRMGGLHYHLGAGSPATGPRGKIPYISISSEGDRAPELTADSTLIITKLVESGTLEDWNARLSPMEKTYDLALRALIEDKLYFYGVFEKWCQNYYTMRDHSLAALPFPVRFVVGNIAYRKITAGLHGQGTSRFTQEEIASFRSQIWDTLNTLLVESRTKSKAEKNDSVFWALGGSEPTELDATLFGFITSGLVCSAAPATEEIIRSHSAIVDYARRLHERYFPDFRFWD